MPEPTPSLLVALPLSPCIANLMEVGDVIFMSGAKPCSAQNGVKCWECRNTTTFKKPMGIVIALISKLEEAVWLLPYCFITQYNEHGYYKNCGELSLTTFVCVDLFVDHLPFASVAIIAHWNLLNV